MPVLRRITEMVIFCCIGLAAACSPAKTTYAPVVDAVPVHHKPHLAHARPHHSEPRLLAYTGHWQWPAHGTVVTYFSPSNKGINIAGQEGSAVIASAAGKVVYCGNGLRGYGNLIIIKHGSHYLSAYAHNKNILVKQDDSVRAGQKIAEMGNTGTQRTMVHFEIRKGGQPVNPLLYLAGKN